MARWVALAQGIYFVTSGLWPIVHLESFLVVTGPKTDLWLVQCFGALVCGIGVALLLSVHRGNERAALPFGFATAVALCSVDVYFVVRGDISPVYLLDAAAEAAIAAVWLIAPYFDPAGGRRRLESRGARDG